MQTTHSGQVYDREFVIDYNSFERNDLMVFSAGYYEQKHIYTAWGERMEQFTERGNWDRLLYVHEDIMGNTRYYTKDNGQSFAELEYDVWGAVTSPSKLTNNDNGNFAAANFTGHPYDTVLDIYFAEARFYDAKYRQWMASDPIKSGLNWYLYVEGNPATYWDPTGLEYYDKNGAIIPVQLDDLAGYVGNTQVHMIMDPQGALYGDLAEMVAGINGGVRIEIKPKTASNGNVYYKGALGYEADTEQGKTRFEIADDQSIWVTYHRLNTYLDYIDSNDIIFGESWKKEEAISLGETPDSDRFYIRLDYFARLLCSIGNQTPVWYGYNLPGFDWIAASQRVGGPRGDYGHNVSNLFGDEAVDVDGEVYTGHLGIDMQKWLKNVYAVTEGTVIDISERTVSNGHSVTLKHEVEGITFYSFYAHMQVGSLNHLYEGQKLQAGEQIGIIGNTGVGVNKHLHLAFYVNNENPEESFGKDLYGYQKQITFTDKESFDHKNLTFFNPAAVVQTQGKIIVDTIKKLSD